MHASRIAVAGLCLLIALRSVQAQTPDQKKATVVYLQSLQTKEGGFLPAGSKPNGESKPSLRATSAAIRALKYFGSEPKDAATASQFVSRIASTKQAGASAISPRANRMS
jgi:hypothetical protein